MENLCIRLVLSSGLWASHPRDLYLRIRKKITVRLDFLASNNEAEYKDLLYAQSLNQAAEAFNELII